MAHTDLKIIIGSARNYTKQYDPIINGAEVTSIPQLLLLSAALSARWASELTAGTMYHPL